MIALNANKIARESGDADDRGCNYCVSAFPVGHLRRNLRVE